MHIYVLCIQYSQYCVYALYIKDVMVCTSFLIGFYKSVWSSFNVNTQTKPILSSGYMAFHEMDIWVYSYLPQTFKVFVPVVKNSSISICQFWFWFSLSCANDYQFGHVSPFLFLKGAPLHRDTPSIHKGSNLKDQKNYLFC